MNPINWFEIAATDIERAKNFYANVFKLEMQYMEMGPNKMYMFAGDPKNAGALGSIFQSESAKPSADGTIIYFTTENIQDELDRVEANGGQVIYPKNSIGDFGFIAHIIDTEGNRVGLHSHQ